jgi:hypothetical protein
MINRAWSALDWFRLLLNSECNRTYLVLFSQTMLTIPTLIAIVDRKSNTMIVVILWHFFHPSLLFSDERFIWLLNVTGKLTSFIWLVNNKNVFSCLIENEKSSRMRSLFFYAHDNIQYLRVWQSQRASCNGWKQRRKRDVQWETRIRAMYRMMNHASDKYDSTMKRTLSLGGSEEGSYWLVFFLSLSSKHSRSK